MDTFDIYQDIAERTGGDIYLGVVGPVRTGKSTFIKRFMDLCVLPAIADENVRARTRDELPQSASGRTIMTTEPKFVPNEAVSLQLDDGTTCSVRLIDCVGYLVPGAEGDREDGQPRMVHTPWTAEAIPFAEAAEMGTEKVIREHATLGVVVTTDGSISDIPRENYREAEERVVRELREIGKPFVIVLNTTTPYGEGTQALREELEESYGAPVLALNCAQLKKEEAAEILKRLLYEFPVREVLVQLPTWVETLEEGHWLKTQLLEAFREVLDRLDSLGNVRSCLEALEDSPCIRRVLLTRQSPGEGSVTAEADLPPELFYRVLSENSGMTVENDAQLADTLKTLAGAKREYDRLATALGDVRRKGYGLVCPGLDELTLEEPELFKQGGRYGVRLRARGETLHLIRAGIETEVSPLVGTEEQSRDFIDEVARDFQENPEKVWDLNLFGRSLSSLVSDGIQSKAYRMPEEAQTKLSATLEKIMNQGSGTLICIVF